MPETNENTLMTPADVAELFGVTTSAVVKWADEGKLRTQRTPGGHRRFRREDVNELLKAGAQ